MPPVNPKRFNLTRRKLLQMSGAMVGSGSLLGSHSFLNNTVSPALAAASGLESESFSFKVVTVNSAGAVIGQQTQVTRGFREILTPQVDLAMVEIPAGNFLMGAPESEPGRTLSEGPQHQVVLQRPFWLSQFPITQAQWRTVAALPKIQINLDPHPSWFEGPNRPIERITWEAAVEFCDRLSQATSRAYRLPTEAEWEYACRAGTTTPFHFGTTLTTDLANCNQDASLSDPVGETTPVGQLGIANRFGLFDMHGNVFEWCADHWHANYIHKPDSLKQDGHVPWLTEPVSLYRVLRGGSWYDTPTTCRAAFRSFGDYNGSGFLIGFRVACARV